MAKKKKSKKQPALWLGLLTIVSTLAVLTLLRLPQAGAPSAQTATTAPPPETTAPVVLPVNPYGAADFRWEGAFLTCTAPDSRIGIDVSSHQGEIDWAAVAESPVEFAMIRLGYRGYATGIMNVDETARENLTAAEAAGLEVGVYFFSQAVSPEEARQEAEFVLKVLEGRALDMPVVYDWEFVTESARTGQMDGAALTECARVFCQVIARAGYTPMVYFNTHIAEDYLTLTELAEYDFWLAQYEQPLDFPHRIRMWQYSESGTVPGIQGTVDLNIWLP